jgi:hypothetical protein
MRHPALHDRVRLTEAVPTLWLECGAVGIVRSVWRSSPVYCEVEFQKPGDSCAIRALVRADFLKVVEPEPCDARPGRRELHHA